MAKGIKGFQKGNKSKLGMKDSVETRRKKSIVHMGKPSGMLGHKRTEGEKMKISKGMLGKNKGKIKGPLSEITKRKLSMARKGIKTGNQIVVHHKDGNHFNDALENRISMTRSEHTTLHWDQGDIMNWRIITV